MAIKEGVFVVVKSHLIKELSILLNVDNTLDNDDPISISRKRIMDQLNTCKFLLECRSIESYLEQCDTIRGQLGIVYDYISEYVDIQQVMDINFISDDTLIIECFAIRDVKQTQCKVEEKI